MTSDTMDRFAESARAVNATVTRTDAEGVGDVLAEVIEPPAVGVEPDIEGVSLSELPVALEPTAAEVADAATGVTKAALGIADYGSVVIRETTAGEEPTYDSISNAHRLLPSLVSSATMPRGRSPQGVSVSSEGSISALTYRVPSRTAPVRLVTAASAVVQAHRSTPVSMAENPSRPGT
jgi:hypothetical protein